MRVFMLGINKGSILTEIDFQSQATMLYLELSKQEHQAQIGFHKPHLKSVNSDGALWAVVSLTAATNDTRMSCKHRSVQHMVS